MTVPELLDTFARLCGDAQPEHVFQQLSDGPAPALAFGAVVHGDETGPLPAFIDLARRLRAGALRYPGRVSLILGNPDAARAGRRFLEADLNRVFVDRPADSLEARRAAALRPLLDEAALFIDFHQVSLPCRHAFWTLPWGPEAALWTRALRGAPAWVTRAPGQIFAAGTCCMDEYVRKQGRPGLTLELGQKGLNPAHARRVVEVVERCLGLAEALPEDPGALARAAAQAPPLELLVTAHKEPFGAPARRLRPGMRYFEPVEAGEELAAPGAPSLLAPQSGQLLFQKYLARDEAGRPLEPLPTDIFHLVRPLDGDPAALWG
ncbi:MAG: succinylglutamate desuccinylase/aspartoacylase family protein [Alphaproteobacteria bacterium]|nr:succinylglutamate desuccinylase/aspartoacylase family protein [Alphaproteobacteria bacterium]